ncbi:unnamed protein product [Linum tenue]|uniref:Nodulin-related protein 1 n=1 Tax=Linum tenue TaxID=586396 RepID=A0AAV0NWJ6_9ROSI|nr:unnamed protein product [Linum tenue]CAI0462978.1 unnamed protein product [Linum tenue]
MDGLFSSLTKAVSGKEEHAPPAGDSSKDAAAGGPAPSNAELLASAKVVAEAAQSAMSSKSDSIDRAKVAGAAEDLVEAAGKYGKLDEKGYGQYVDKAEEYLRQYSGSKPADTDAAAAAAPAEEVKEKPAEGGSLGGYAKMAEGFFK